MRRTVFTGRRGLAPVLLTVVIVWALAAVLMLTGTLLAARSIRKDVGVITPVVNDINGDTKNVALALKVKKVSSDIAKSLKPLDQELQDTLGAAKRIDITAKSILGKAGRINSVVRAINGNVLQIGNTVNAISGNARSINANAQSINASARGINASARGINGSALSVNSDVRSIFNRTGSILETARSAETEVAGINKRAETARSIVRPIKADLDSVLGLVGKINASANSIDCADAINGQACTRARLSARQAKLNSQAIYKSVFGEKPTRRNLNALNRSRKLPKVKVPRVPDSGGGGRETAPSVDKQVTSKLKDPVKAAQEVTSQLTPNLDAALDLVPGLNSRAGSLACGLIKGSACSRPR